VTYKLRRFSDLERGLAYESVRDFGSISERYG
jgi:hypothetical protein